jgi:hypothetical protein
MLVHRPLLALVCTSVVSTACASAKDTGSGETSAASVAPTSVAADDDDDPSTPSDPSDPSDPSAPDPTDVDDTGPAGDDCCLAHAGPGCNDVTVEACVCQDDAVCCTFDWDAACVAAARNRCGACGGGSATTDPTTGPEPTSTSLDDGATSDMTASTDPTQTNDACCQVTASPGCPSDPQLEACVCQLDEFCCMQSWDEICVGEAITDCGAMCTFGTGCCEPHPSPGCDEVPVETCVCAIDPFCCQRQWDTICVGQVTSEQCGAC